MNAVPDTRLDALVNAWANWMCSMSLHVTVLVALLWFLDRVLRRTSARVRFTLWLLLLARLVVPPDLALPTGIVWWLGDWYGQALEMRPWSALLSPPISPTDMVMSVDARLGAPAGSAVDAAREADKALPWLGWLCMIWLGAVLAQLSMLILAAVEVRRWLASAAPIQDSSTHMLLQSAQRRSGVHHPVRLLDCGHCTTPIVIGWRRPVVLLPTVLRSSLTEKELESVLVHELMHVARGDAWWRGLMWLLRSLYFFHPAVWFAWWKMEHTCEEACDEQTINALSGRRRDYAQAIVKAATMVGYRPPHIALSMLSRCLPVQGRLRRILDPGLPLTERGAIRGWLGMALLAALVLPSGTRPAPAKSAEPFVARASAEDWLPDQAQRAQEETREQTERMAISQMASEDFDQRMAAYAALRQWGTARALAPLEAAFLNRSGLEQDAAKQALDHVWQVIRTAPMPPTQTNTPVASSRQFENQAEIE